MSDGEVPPGAVPLPESGPDVLSDEYDLLKRVSEDVKVAYSAAVISALVVLRRSHDGAGAFVEWRNKFKMIAGFSAQEFDRVVAVEWERTSSLIGDPEDPVVLLNMLAEEAEYFVDEANDNIVFAELPDANCQGIVVSIFSRQYRRWLTRKFMARQRRAPGRDALKIAIDGVDASVDRVNRKRPLFIRVGHHDGKVYIDRGLPEGGSFIEADEHGWRLVSATPVKFMRPSKGLSVLPVPQRGGDIRAFQKLLNLKEDRDFVLLVGWIVACYRPLEKGGGAGEYGLLLLLGPHGAAKTTALKLAFALVDPVRTKPMGPPREDRDVLVVAQENFALGIDNVKHISVERAGVYCRLLSGASSEARSLYTDSEVASIAAHRPIAVTATTMVVTEEDLSDRTLLIRSGKSFEGRKTDKRKTSSSINAEFDKLWPRLLGCILDAVSAGLKNHAMAEPDFPRLADMAYWLHRCEGGFGPEWKAGTMLAALKQAIEETAEDVANLDPVASAVVAFMADGDKDAWGPELVSKFWALLKKQNQVAGISVRDFPSSPNAFSHRLRQLHTILQRNRLEVTFNKTEKGVTVEITRIADQPQPNGEDEGAETQDETLVSGEVRL